MVSTRMAMLVLGHCAQVHLVFREFIHGSISGVTTQALLVYSSSQPSPSHCRYELLIINCILQPPATRASTKNA